MQPYQPILLNDRNEKGVSQQKYMQLLNYTPQKLYSKSIDLSMDKQFKYQQTDTKYQLPLVQDLLFQNQILKAQLKEEQNKAQLAENKYLYLQMMRKKMEYEHLMHKEKQQQEKQMKLPKLEQSYTSRKNSIDTKIFTNLYGEQQQQQNNNVIVEQERKRAQTIMTNRDPQPKINKKQQKNVLSNEEIQQKVMEMKEQKRIEQEKKEHGEQLWRKFLRCYLIIRIVIKWSENIRKQRLLKQKLQQEQLQKAKQLYKQIRQFNVTQQQDIEKEWVYKIVQGLFKQMMGDEMKKVFTPITFSHKTLQYAQTYKKWLIYFSIITFKNLEEFSRSENLHPLIATKATLQLYRTADKQASLFVASRTSYLTNKSNDLPETEIQLIASEFVLYNIFIPNFILFESEQKYYNLNHSTQCRQLIIDIMSILQMLFMIQFQNLNCQNVFSKITLIQRRLEINIQKQNELKFIIDNNIDNQQTLIVGLEKKKKYEKIFEQNQEIFEDLKRFLDATIDNIDSSLYF